MKITLPVVIYELIGDMAGDKIYKLVFRMTKKRKELSSKVRIECRHTGQSYPLHTHTWKQGCQSKALTYFCCLKDDYYLERSNTDYHRWEHHHWMFSSHYRVYRSTQKFKNWSGFTE